MVRENGMYTILLPPSIQFPLWESTNFPKIQVYQVSHVDVHHVLEGLVTSSPFDKNAWQWTWKTGPTRNKSMWSMLLILLPIKNAETSHTSPTSPKTREETTFGSCFRNELFLGTPTQSCLGLSDKNSNYIYFMLAILLRSPLSAATLILCRSPGASTTHLGCSHHCHHAKEDQASDTTYSHRCLATEILSSIWTWDCHCWQPRASIPTI